MNFQKLHLIIASICCCVSVSIGQTYTMTFEDSSYSDNQNLGHPYYYGSSSENFKFTLQSGANHRYESSGGFCNAFGSAGVLEGGTSANTSWSFETMSGNEFELNSIKFANPYTCYSFSYSITVTGYKNGVSTGTGQAFTVTGSSVFSSFSPSLNFDDVDKVVISGTNIGALCIDEITWSSSAVPCTMTASITSQTNVNCNGDATGSLTVSPASGASPYTYSWNNGASSATANSLVAGTYTVTISDNNACTATASATVTEPTALTASTTLDKNVSCSGGSDGELTGSGSGGSSSYTYSWSNGGTTASQVSLPAGTYTVTITDNNGCTATSSKTITSPAALDAGEIQ